MLSVSSILHKYQLVESKILQKVYIGYQLQLFVIEHINLNFKNLTILQQKQFIQNVLISLQKQSNILNQKIFIKILFLLALLNFASFSIFNDYFNDFILQISQKLNIQLNAKQNTGDMNFLNRLTKKISNIKSMVNLSIKNDKTKEKSINQTNVFKQIINQILYNLRKLIQSINFWKDIREKHQKNEKIYVEGQNLQFFRLKVWKIINMIKGLSVISKKYRKLEILEYNQLKPLMIATFFMLGHIYLKLYPYLITLMSIYINLVKNKYKSINTLKLGKEIKMRRYGNLSQDSVFIQTQNLLQQFVQINEIILYIFCGKLHSAYINIPLKEGSFISTTSKQFDEIYSIIKEVKQADRKNKKQKCHMSMVNDKLDKPVSAMIQKNINTSYCRSNYGIDTLSTQTHPPIFKIKFISLKQQNAEEQKYQYQKQIIRNLDFADQLTQNI